MTAPTINLLGSNLNTAESALHALALETNSTTALSAASTPVVVATIPDRVVGAPT